MVEHSPKILTTNTSEEKATTIQVMSLPVFFFTCPNVQYHCPKVCLNFSIKCGLLILFKLGPAIISCSDSITSWLGG